MMLNVFPPRFRSQQTAFTRALQRNKKNDIWSSVLSNLPKTRLSIEIYPNHYVHTHQPIPLFDPLNTVERSLRTCIVSRVLQPSAIQSEPSILSPARSEFSRFAERLLRTPNRLHKPDKPPQSPAFIWNIKRSRQWPQTNLHVFSQCRMKGLGCMLAPVLNTWHWLWALTESGLSY
jgi:hypothetical protein